MNPQKIKIVAYNPEIELDEQVVLDNVRYVVSQRIVWLDDMDGIIKIQVDGTERISFVQYGTSETEVKLYIYY